MPKTSKTCLTFLSATLLFVFGSTSLRAQSVPQFGHVFLLVEENTNYSSVVGSSNMPYLNSLISKYGLGTGYDATTHPSIGNYFSLTTGEILTNNDSDTPSSFKVSNDNIIRELIKSGKTWKDYAESIPSVGYLGGNSGNYYVRHNPIPYFTDVNCGTSACIVEAQHIVPFSQLASDITNNTLPQFGYIVPNACDDAHNCSLSTADNWLKSNIAPLINSAAFQKNGLLIIVFDENSSTGTSCSTSASVSSNCGGQVADVLVSPLLKSSGIKVSTFFNHFSTLRTIMQGLGMTTYPGVAASASAQSAFFGTASTSNTPVASLSPTSLSFGSVTMGTTSSALAVTLKNTGNATLDLSGITTNGSFTETHNCGSTLAATASCTIDVKFSPQTTGTLSGTLSITDNASGSPQHVSLSGTGVSTTSTSGPVASISPTSLSLGSVTVGTTSAAKSFVLKNTGKATMDITYVSVTGGFTQSHTCGTTLAVGASCTFSVSLTPTTTGTYSGHVAIYDNAPGSPQIIGLSATAVSSSTSSSGSATGGITVSPTSLSFGSVKKGTTSAAKSIILHNGTTKSAAMYTVWIGWSYKQSNNCGSSLAPGASCTISVSFDPLGTGTINEKLYVDAGGVKINTPLTGTGY